MCLEAERKENGNRLSQGCYVFVIKCIHLGRRRKSERRMVQQTNANKDPFTHFLDKYLFNFMSRVCR